MFGPGPTLRLLRICSDRRPDCHCAPDAPLQVLAAVFGPKPVETRSQEDEKRCLVKCEYAMASFSTGTCSLKGQDYSWETNAAAAAASCGWHGPQGTRRGWQQCPEACAARTRACCSRKQPMLTHLHSGAQHVYRMASSGRRFAHPTLPAAPLPTSCNSAGERRRRGKGDRRATEITKAIRNCLEQTILVELMPRSQIDVYVQVLQVGVGASQGGRLGRLGRLGRQAGQGWMQG